MVTPINLLVSKVLETLFNMAKEELAMQLRLVDDVKKLQNTLERLECYLQDSEKKIIEDDSTKRWLNQINHAMYDIEDLLEEYDALKINNSESMSSKEVRSSSSSSTKVRFWLSVKISGFKKVASNHRIGVDLRRLNKQLNDEIKGQIPELSFMINFAPTGPVESQIRSNNRTTAVVVRSDIVGNRIQDDARRLIKLLTKDDDRDNPLVYAIVGMGGIGKTTLAKLVFDDHIIASRFQVNVWVSVSQNYNENDILRNIITSAGGDGKRCHNFDSLSKKVIDMVKDKRVFMVLDDVWETKRVWNDMLRILLKRGVAEGSRVLVTTRNEEVAAQMMAVHSQRVQSLPLEDGWSLLCKSAFPAWEQLEAKDDKWNLKDIGIELVKKCDGLPLAINAIGGMLSSQSRTRESWEFILKSSSWEVKGLPDEINSVLYISYQYLPRDIKRCFLYCSLFPKGRYFKIMNAKNLWIQEGLINDEKNRSSHDVAERYFRILVQRNLVILDRVYIEAAYFKMHDLVYSLSQFLTRNENLVATEEREILNSEFDGKIKKLRRLSFIGGHNETTKIQKKCLQEQVSLRTLLTFDKTIYNIDNDLFNHLRHLRILWLRGTKVTELPASLGSLKLLRYLNLSQTPIKELPITIQNLNALRILDVSECENLRNLPSCIMKLHHLCSLTTKGTALDHLPQGVGNLNKLQLLEFIVPLDKGIARESSTVKELETLTELRQLNLCKLERVLDSSQTKSASLKDKPHLKELILSCSERDSNEVCTDDSDRIEVVFEDLCPPVQLKILKITNYFGCKLPSWLGSRLFNIRFLKITGCSNCKKLDGLGLLPFLEAFYIEGASSIKNIGPEFYTNNNIENDAYQNSVLFRRMKLLSFENMDSWEEWSSLGNDIRVMPFLEVLQIYACPKLKSIPEEVLSDSYLKRIRICKARQLLKKLHNPHFLEIIEIGNIPYLEKISGVPALRRLKIEDCPGINLVELTHTLQNIDWKDFNADSLPIWFSPDGHGDDDNIKATYVQISCKEELVRNNIAYRFIYLYYLLSVTCILEACRLYLTSFLFDFLLCFVPTEESQEKPLEEALIIPASLKFVISNIKIIVPVQLSSDNYPVWRSQVMKLLTANGFASYLSSSTSPPATHKTLQDGSKELNPRHQEWVLVDQNLAAALCSTVSPAILSYVIHLNSTSTIWQTLEKRLQSSNRSRVIQLKNELHNIQMKSQSMTQYMQQIKNIVDNISSAGSEIDQEDVLLYTMNGLPPSYNALKTTIRAMQSPMDLDTLYSLLITEEINLQSESARHNLLGDSSTALYSNRGRGRRGRARSSTQPSRSTNQNVPYCQICNKRGHLAHNCWHRLKNSVNPPDPITTNPSNTAMVAATDNENPDWYLDSGASVHLTNSVDNLSQAQSYTGTDSITIGDGRSLSIAHSGNGILPTPYRKLHLKNLFHVPHLSHNLLSISNLTQDNNVSVNFNPSGFAIKDLKTNKTLLTGPNRRGLYPIQSANKSNYGSTALTASSNIANLWHQRLGHPHSRIIHAVSASDKSLNIPHNFSFCSACTTSKGHRLPFSNKNHRTFIPLAIVHTDVWGPAPVPSNQGFLYYVVFIDDFSRFTWVFPMRHKSEVFEIFQKFKTYVEKQTQFSIKCLRSDGGMEYLNNNFRNFLSHHGIAHQTSCPYTPEQNGLAERKHRHLLETTRTLITTASLLPSLWPDAVLTASFIINRLPTAITGYRYLGVPATRGFRQLKDTNWSPDLAAVCLLDTHPSQKALATRQLNLCKLERVLDSSQTKSASLKDKPHLKELILSCSERDSNEVCTDDSDRIEVVFEDLCPPVQLKILKITNYFGCKLPSWLGSRLFNIRFLKITGCSNCKKLDGLGLLPFLEAFYIEGASSIKNIGPEFYTNNNIENGAYQNSVLFRSMKLLSFENMDSWEEWSSLGKDIRVMPCLEVLQIYACPKLKSIPEEALFHAASYLKRIRICTAPQLLLKKLHYLRFLEIIEIGNIPYLEKISGVPVLRRLKIEDCPGINLVELTHTLQNIDWKDFNADSLPMWFSTDGHGDDNNIKATYLQISCKEELVRKICVNDVHEWSKIQQFDNIIVLDENERLRLTHPEMPNSFTKNDEQVKWLDVSGPVDEEELIMLKIRHGEVEEPIIRRIRLQTSCPTVEENDNESS
ncbi:uncharacterized protein LOC110093684 [Dendrobium catenatum]|uniref:uncharacterized protein LOC110093684 n=1 Tax=Dendrobium catenatum TaxID=906689 RepID=UPI00109FAC90|nr:uncharacterized protein LOC110093684 [Dendrobium catenatum]